MKSDTVSLMGDDWEVKDLYFPEIKLLLEVEIGENSIFKSTIPINYLKKGRVSPLDFHPAVTLHEEH